MRSRTIILLIIVAVVIALGCLTNGNENTEQNSASGPPVINVTPQSYEFGNIGFDPVSHDFTIKNTGGEVLKILDVRTNCGCTTASIDEHDLAAGEEATLTVTFDPMHHESTGDFMREAIIESNDPRQPVTMVQISMTVVDGM